MPQRRGGLVVVCGSRGDAARRLVDLGGLGSCYFCRNTVALVSSRRGGCDPYPSQVGTFDERLAAARAAKTAAVTAARRAEGQETAADTAARSKAQALKPAVEAAIAAVAALPLPAPYRATELDRHLPRPGPELPEKTGLYRVHVLDDFHKPRIGKTGTVTPSGWGFSLRHSTGAYFRVRVYRGGRATFSVETPEKTTMYYLAPREYSLEQFCSLGVVRWKAGSFKDSYWKDGVVYVDDGLERFLDTAAALVAKYG